MDEFISANPCSFDHAALFEMVQRLTLDHRLQRHLLLPGMVQPGPGVRPGRVLRQERGQGMSQAPVLPPRPPQQGRQRRHDRPHSAPLQLRFLCLPLKVDEKERFEEIKERLRVILENQIVLMKDIVTPVPQEEVKGVIRKCLEQAAQLNYLRITEYAKIEGKKREMYEHPVFCLA
ncbi:hypothetical protein CRUP_003813, partial [Coryphaenoides rupestris]